MNATRNSMLRRFSLDPGHWRHVRRLLIAESVVLSVIGVAGLAASWISGPISLGGADGMELTPMFCGALLLVAVAAAVSATRRGFALWFTAGVAVAALALVIISAVAAAYSAPGPLGFTPAAPLLYAAAFVFHFAIGVWLIPDRIEGPEWVETRTDRSGQGPA